MSFLRWASGAVGCGNHFAKKVEVTIASRLVANFLWPEMLSLLSLNFFDVNWIFKPY